ncbi:CbrC family protein [Actinoplanes italicus]|uniref:CbrC family protein n=1 Tax=Actinoplanes italicus TaxID=113567 RepID=UPI0035A22AAE
MIRTRWPPAPSGPVRSSVRVCGQARSMIYTGPVFAADEIENELCPWCVAAGSRNAGCTIAATEPNSTATSAPRRSGTFRTPAATWIGAFFRREPGAAVRCRRRVASGRGVHGWGERHHGGHGHG